MQVFPETVPCNSCIRLYRLPLARCCSFVSDSPPKISSCLLMFTVHLRAAPWAEFIVSMSTTTAVRTRTKNFRRGIIPFPMLHFLHIGGRLSFDKRNNPIGIIRIEQCVFIPMQFFKPFYCGISVNISSHHFSSSISSAAHASHSFNVRYLEQELRSSSKGQSAQSRTPHS